MGKEKEVWKDVNGWEGRYLISNYGNVYSIRFKKTLRPGKDSKGRLQVVLRIKLKGETKRIHRLVAAAFVPNPHNLKEVNHIDGIASNNFYSNLEWVNRVENTHYYFRKNLFIGTSWRKHEKKFRSVIYFNGEDIYLGRYDSAEEGHIAYLMASLMYKPANKYLAY